MARFGGPAHGVSAKSSQTDQVSDADREAEAHIRDLLARERPEDGLLAEEGSGAESASGRRWVVDPLDGTTNFLYGHPMWCVSVALEDAAGGLVGVVHDPTRGETFRAARGRGAELDGDVLRMPAAVEVEAALVATGFGYEPGVRAAQADALRRVLPRVRDVRRGGSAALDLAYVAAGRVDAYYEVGPKRWDWAAGALIVAEAGGAVASIEGEPPGLAAAGTDLLPALLDLVTGT